MLQYISRLEIMNSSAIKQTNDRVLRTTGTSYGVYCGGNELSTKGATTTTDFI
jgi:hypothetical protein